jgi:uncharacterized Zn-binding protein involved in type VI secretion
LIVVGDRTDHGGVVIEGEPTSDTHGKSIARVGDRVTCPKKGHGGTTIIATGDPTFIIDGRPAARHGDKTACGATLLASQVVTYTEEGAAAGQSGEGQVGMGAVGSKLASAEPVRFEWDEQVKLAVSGDTAIMVGLPWFIRTADGRTLSGRLGDDGQLPRIDTAAEVSYETFWGDEALEKMQGASS